MKKEICFDMDGTLADFYSVRNWLLHLQQGSTYPYEAARPMFVPWKLMRRLRELQRDGYKIKIISWGAKNCDDDFSERITAAKLAWLDVWFKFFEFDEIDIVPYGTPKSWFGEGILFDDEEANREEWGENAYRPDQIMEVLNSL